jgi:hypothetical protein
MKFIMKSFAQVAVITAISFAVAGCHGQGPGASGYVPAGAGALPEAQTPGLAPISPDAKSHKIKSTCGERIHIVLLGVVDCKFNEKGFGGTFKVYDHTKGLIAISPSSGTKATTFTVTGLLVGKGSFLIKDQRGNHLKVRVHVTTI